MGSGQVDPHKSFDMSKDLYALAEGEVSADGSLIILEIYNHVEELWDDFHEETYTSSTTEIYGFRLTSKNYKGVTFQGDSLFFEDKEVCDYADWCKTLPNLVGKLPKWFVIRAFDGEYWRFVSGFDLCEDGTVWCGGINELGDSDGGSSQIRVATVKDAITHISNVLGDCEWKFFMEEQQHLR